MQFEEFENETVNVNMSKSTGNGGGSGGGGNNNVDFAKVEEALFEILGGEEGSDTVIGVVSNIYGLGEQEQPEETVPLNSKDGDNNAWRLESKDDGVTQKDPTAYVTKGQFRGHGEVQDLLKFTPQPVEMMAMVVDFPNYMVDYGVLYGGKSSEPSPYRVILGEDGWVPEGYKNRGKYVVYPTKLKHSNVNREKEGAEALWAVAPNSALAKMAKWVGATREDGYFRCEDMLKLIGKPMLFSFDVKWNTWKCKKTGDDKKQLKVTAKPNAKLPKGLMTKEWNDHLLPLMKPEMFGRVLFNGVNKEEVVKKMRKSVANTMRFSLGWNESQVKEDIEKYKPDWVQGWAESDARNGVILPCNRVDKIEEDSKPSTPTPQAPKKQVEVGEPNLPVEDNFDFDDDLIPF